MRLLLPAVTLTAAALLIPATTTAAAAATPAPTRTPDSAAATGVEAQVRAAAKGVEALQASADRAGAAAQRADERYLRAADAAHRARLTAADDAKAATAARAAATASKQAASLAAAGLARRDMGTMPLDLLLNSRTSGGVLTGLSSMSRLSIQNQQVFQRAETDRIAADRAQATSATAARAASRRAAAAAAALRDAREQARSAERAVAAQRTQQQRLLVRLAALQDGTVAAACASLGADAAAICDPATVVGAPSGGTSGDSAADRVVAWARQQIGKPYVFAAAGPASFDCSGLTLSAWASVGVAIGTHSATDQYRTAAAKGELVPVADAREGDLLFYGDGAGGMAHVTIYSGDGMMIEAPYPGRDVREVPVRTDGLAAQAAHLG